MAAPSGDHDTPDRGRPVQRGSYRPAAPVNGLAGAVAGGIGESCWAGAGTGAPTLRYNCVFGNDLYDYSGITDPTGTDGNIAVDPLSVQRPDDGGDGWGDDPWTPDVDESANDDYGDLYLLPGSPCVDAGDNAAVPVDVITDLDGNPRFVNAPATPDTGSGTPPIVDMGAYEFLPSFLDIKPGSCPNPFNRNSHGVLPVAVVGGA